MTSTKSKGRPRKPQGGKSFWVPAHLVWHVNALLEADKAEQAKRIRPLDTQPQQVSS